MATSYSFNLLLVIVSAALITILFRWLRGSNPYLLNRMLIIRGWLMVFLTDAMIQIEHIDFSSYML